MGRADSTSVVRGSSAADAAWCSFGPAGTWAVCAAVLALLATAPQARGQVLLDAEPTRLPQVDLALLTNPVPARSRAPLQTTSPGFSADAAANAGPGLNLALRWRPGTLAGHAVEGQVWHRVGRVAADPSSPVAPEEPTYGARVEMQLSPNRPLASLRDMLGMQLDNNSRISLRPSKGKVSIYYKMQF